MKSRIFRRFAFAAALSLSASSMAYAQHLHAGDVELGADAGVVVIDPEGLAGYAADGRALFEGDFRDFAGGAYSTDDPGFISEAGAFTPGAILYFEGVGSLLGWNGSSWAAVATDVSVAMVDALGAQTVFSASGVTNPVGAIAQINGEGEVHSHLDFLLQGADRALAGAYLIELRIGSDLYGYSSPFYMAFNAGLDEAGFESAVGALTAPVPEPGSCAMLIAGLGLTWRMARRRIA